MCAAGGVQAGGGGGGAPHCGCGAAGGGTGAPGAAAGDPGSTGVVGNGSLGSFGVMARSGNHVGPDAATTTAHAHVGRRSGGPPAGFVRTWGRRPTPCAG